MNSVQIKSQELAKAILESSEYKKMKKAESNLCDYISNIENGKSIPNRLKQKLLADVLFTRDAFSKLMLQVNDILELNINGSISELKKPSVCCSRCNQCNREEEN